MDEAIERIGQLHMINEELISQISCLFFNNQTIISSSVGSPCDAFRFWIRRVIERNQGANRNVIRIKCCFFFF